MAHGDITHVDIPVSDTARASAFYSTLFGWSIAEVPGFGRVLAVAVKAATSGRAGRLSRNSPILLYEGRKSSPHDEMQ